jgi:hypothetical protein
LQTEVIELGERQAHENVYAVGEHSERIGKSKSNFGLVSSCSQYPALNKITSASFAKSTWVNIVLSNQTKVTWSRALSALSRDFCTTRHKSGSSCRSLGHHDRLRFGSFGHRRSHARATLGTYPASGGQSFAQKAKGEESALSF